LIVRVAKRCTYSVNSSSNQFDDESNANVTIEQFTRKIADGSTLNKSSHAFICSLSHSEKKIDPHCFCEDNKK